MRTLTLIVSTAVALFAATADAQTCRWGSFDGSRINYGDGPLTGAAHDTLRNIITTNGGTVAPATATLTSAYLAGVEVFYTSMLSTASGGLSPSELSALHNWVASGGTLIVTCEYSPIAHYNAIMAPYGVSFSQVASQGAATVVQSHLLTSNNVTKIKYASESEIFYGNDALLLAQNPSQQDFMIVQEAQTGFVGGGRILSFGDHNTFTDSYISFDDTIQLARNMVVWACTGGCPGFFQSVGTGCVGLNGATPTLTGGGCLTPGDQVNLQLANAAPGALTITLFGLGAGPAPVTPSCTLSNAPIVLAPVIQVPAGPNGGWILSAIIPLNATVPADVWLQTAVIDASAPDGIAASNAIRLHLDI